MRVYLLALLVSLLAIAPGKAAAAEVTVEVGDFFYCSASDPVGTCETMISVGDTVRWTYDAGTEGHTVTHCGESCDSPTSSPLFDSGGLNTGGSFSFTFDTPGRYLYYCVFHPPFMRAAVVVKVPPPTQTPAPAAQPATPTPTIAPTEEPSPTPTATPLLTTAPTPSPATTPAPSVEEGADGGGNATPWIAAGAIAIALVSAAGGFYVWRRRTR
ncbi:MAG TPA: plastocyanin/azurin family copper-binding protein [Dehalococcoidia bacterium]|nr:plastocyanin/azurin family copper-binding protein [Dehalococcoidia bacterium]